jgi:hypothetical protein
MIVVPPLTPDTKPDDPSTVAIAVFAELQVPPDTVELKELVVPMQMV